MYSDSIEAARSIFELIIPKPFIPPVRWCEKNISFENDPSARLKKIEFDFTPYLRDVVSAWDFSGVIKEITVVAPEQTGKSLSWYAPLIWSMEYKPCLSLVVYPSDDLSERINKIKIEPMMQAIPYFAKELILPGSKRRDHYNFTSNKSYFIGSGSRITSVNSKINIADELDDWLEHEGHVANLDDLRKRRRSFAESLLVKVCSPKGGQGLTGSKIWDEFQSSSKGYWFLCCLKCGNLTMKSCDIHNMQFESTKGHEVVAGSCRLICPACRHEHTETDKKEMNLKGAYIHEKPELVKTNVGFQWGALASQLEDLCWDNIAQAQLNAGSSGSLKSQIYFDNSIRGLPFKVRRRDEKRESTIKRHQAPLPPVSDIKYRLMTVDTQDDCFYWLVRGFDEKDNSWLLGYGKALTLIELESAWNQKHESDLCKMAMIDSGGHRTNEVAAFVKDKAGFFLYKGSGSMGARWRPSKETPKLILANPGPYHAELLYLIYGQDKRDNNYWFLPMELDASYIEQILDVKPDNKTKNGNSFENWKGSGSDHYFDCEKEMLVLHEMYLQVVKNTRKTDQRTAKVPINQ